MRTLCWQILFFLKPNLKLGQILSVKLRIVSIANVSKANGRLRLPLTVQNSVDKTVGWSDGSSSDGFAGAPITPVASARLNQMASDVSIKTAIDETI